MAPESILLPPNQMTATVVRFMVSIIIGMATATILFTLMAVLVKSLFTSLNRANS